MRAELYKTTELESVPPTVEGYRQEAFEDRREAADLCELAKKYTGPARERLIAQAGHFERRALHAENAARRLIDRGL